MSTEEFKAMLRKSNGRVEQIFDRYERGLPITTEDEEAEFEKLKCLEGFLDLNDIETTKQELGEYDD